ncbi:hypothetical protein ACWGSK_16940 [Nocardiopsis sp. NPDC055551]
MQTPKEPHDPPKDPASADGGPWLPAPDHVDPTTTEVEAVVKDPDPLPKREPKSGAGRRKRVPAAQKRPSSPGRPSKRDGEPWRLRPQGLEGSGVLDRWKEVQIGFVDDPRSSVAEADALAAEVAEAVVAALEERRTALRAAWDGAEDVDTEVLRLALRDYRSFVRHLSGEET